jgi:hypothetical protein
MQVRQWLQWVILSFFEKINLLLFSFINYFFVVLIRFQMNLTLSFSVFVISSSACTWQMQHVPRLEFLRDHHKSDNHCWCSSS